MPYELLKKEVVGLSDDQIMLLVEFAQFLRQHNALSHTQQDAEQKRKAFREMTKMQETNPFSDDYDWDLSLIHI